MVLAGIILGLGAGTLLAYDGEKKYFVVSGCADSVAWEVC